MKTGFDASRAVPGSANGESSRLFLSGCLLIVVLVFAAYLPALHSGFIWDDDAYVTANPLLTAPDGLVRIWFSAHNQSQYFPMVFSVFRLERGLWGLNPFGYHLVNVCQHSINALLVWVVLRRLAVPGAWLAAALFALHPVQVESVAWVTELKNTQSTLFYLLALLVWMKFLDEKTSRAWIFYAIAIVLHALALFSKTTACTLPAAMILVLWLRNQPISWRRLLEIGPFLLMGVVMGLVSVWWEGHLGNYIAGSGIQLGAMQRVLIASRGIWFYAGKLIWPANLTFSYPRWDINPSEASQYLWLIGCGVAAAVLWRCRRVLGRGTLVAVVFFIATLSPTLGFFPLYTFYYSFVADHYQYLACVGPLALIAALVSHFTARWPAGRHVRAALAVLVLSVLWTLTWRQAGVYQDLETLWRDTLKKNPGSWLALNNLGMFLSGQGRKTEAETYFYRALALQPNDADIHYNLANLLATTGRINEALAHYQRAAQLRPTDPDIRNNLGVAFFSTRHLDAAVREFREAIRYRPDSAAFHVNLGNALFAQHKFTEAAREFTAALWIDPGNAEAAARLRALGAQLNRPGGSQF